MLSGSILAKDAYVFHPGISAEDYNIEDQQIDTPFIKLQPTGQTDRNGNRKREGERKRERETDKEREREAEVREAERARGIEYRAQNVLFHDSFGLIQDQNVADLASLFAWIAFKIRSPSLITTTPCYLAYLEESHLLSWHSRAFVITSKLGYSCIFDCFYLLLLQPILDL